ncbi:hypothetical protein MTX20_01495 (plasmid) [Bradyrhizobium sp. ISRA435]|nr:hypothetical protein MTX20_01495 [Bradyrhizobium sp. ISRA435]
MRHARAGAGHRAGDRWGTTAFITLLGTLLSLEKTQSAYYERFKFADIFANVRRAPESVANELVRIPGVKQVTTRIVFNVVVDVGGMREPINSLLISAPREGEATLNNIYIRKGRLVRPGPADEVVMIEPFAEANGLHLGSHFCDDQGSQKRAETRWDRSLSRIYLLGVPGAMVPDDRRFGVMWMDRDALAAAFDLREAANDVVFPSCPLSPSTMSSTRWIGCCSASVGSEPTPERTMFHMRR